MNTLRDSINKTAKDRKNNVVITVVIVPKEEAYSIFDRDGTYSILKHSYKWVDDNGQVKCQWFHKVIWISYNDSMLDAVLKLNEFYSQTYPIKTFLNYDLDTKV